MAKLVPAKPTLAPPTVRQLEALQQGLQRCLFIEHAAALAGIPKQRLYDWIQAGRAGKHDFVPFVEMLDKQLAETANGLLSPVVEAARDGNIKAAMWLYQQRVKPYEEHALKKMFEKEDELEAMQQMVIDAEGETVNRQLGDDLMAKLSQLPAANSAVTQEKL